MAHRKVILILVLQLFLISLSGQKFEGYVLDKETKEPLSYVEVFLVDLNTGTLTDENGFFRIEHFNREKIHLEISYVGYEMIDEVVNTTETPEKTFYMEPAHIQLKEVTVSVPTGRLQGESVVSVARKKIEELKTTAPITLAEAISNIPGVEQNTTGAGIGKPVIRGLTGNRIVTYAQGMRIENQQWGDEHGLGVGEVGIGSVEVIKGPASLLYGSDALGGVLYFVDEPYCNHNTSEISIQSKFLSNTFGTINDISYKTHREKLKFNLFGSYSSQADYSVPELNRVDNTRFDEKNIKGSLGLHNDNWVSNIRYSFLQNDFGITEEATYLTSAERKFKLPFQTINNHNLSVENNFFGENSTWHTTLGYSGNYRREFEDDKVNPALGLHLNTYTYNVKWSSPTYRDFLDLIIGSQGMFQQNKNDGEEVLIPDAQTTDVGAYALANINRNNLQFQAGIRFDNRNINTQTTDNIPAFRHAYQGLTFSGGLVYKWNKIKLRANLSNGFRAPNTSELLSDGVHEGTNRYEKGNSELSNENATQIDFSIDYKSEHFELSVNPFYNHIRNYIFLDPTDEVIDNNPVFQYLQTDAALYGGEAGFHYHPHQLHWLHIESDLSLVMAEDKAGNPLPLIPQTKINSTISAAFKGKHTFQVTKIFLQHIYRFRQDRVGLFETPTRAYQLLNAGVSAKIKAKKYPIELNAGVKNLLNAHYIDHLSRFKALGIENPGINFYVSVLFKSLRF